MPVLITFDGPKGVGKTTLIQRVEKRLFDIGHAVDVLSEKILMAEVFGTEVDDAYRALKASPGLASEQALAQLHMRGRIRIEEAYFRNSEADVLLLDRWYPSDAVFRQHIDIAATIEANLQAGVRMPDVAFAVTCNADVSWKRAHLRARQLDSKVIDTFDDHKASTMRFERMARRFDWRILRTEDANPDELSDLAVTAIKQVLEPTNLGRSA